MGSMIRLMRAVHPEAKVSQRNATKLKHFCHDNSQSVWHGNMTMLFGGIDLLHCCCCWLLLLPINTCTTHK